MPYIHLADRTSGEILSAAYLNSLSQNVEWLYGQANAVNMPFQGYRNDAVGSINSATVQWLIRHRLQYLRYKVDVNDPLDYIRLKATDGTSTFTLFANENPGATQQFASFVDVDAAGLVVGTWYKLYWEIAFVSGSHQIIVSRLWEGNSSTSFGTSTASAYSAPPTWVRGETVSAADINLYKTALDAAHGLLGDDQFNFAVRQNNTEDRGFFFQNRYRWLHYQGDGEIVDPSGTGETVTISGDGTNIMVYDLFNVSWLTQGVRYEVKDCVFACEDFDP